MGQKGRLGNTLHSGRSPDSEFEALLADWVEQDAKIMIHYKNNQKDIKLL